ncbi:hypothetical protein D3C78_1177120 [compost metagenome]
MIEIGLFNHLFEAEIAFTHPDLSIVEEDLLSANLMLPGQHVSQSLFDGQSRILRRLAVQVGAGGCRRRRGVRHFTGIGGGDLDTLYFHLKYFGDNLRHLGVQPLAHLGTAVVELNAAVGVNQYQRPRLIEEAGGKGDTEFDRRQRQPLLQDWVLCVELPNSQPPRLIIGTALQFGGDLLQQILFHRLMVMGDVALIFTVVIGFTHRQRI